MQKCRGYWSAPQQGITFHSVLLFEGVITWSSDSKKYRCGVWALIQQDGKKQLSGLHVYLAFYLKVTFSASVLCCFAHSPWKFNPGLLPCLGIGKQRFPNTFLKTFWSLSEEMGCSSELLKVLKGVLASLCSPSQEAESTIQSVLACSDVSEGRKTFLWAFS